ncbi:putative transcriptional regulator, MerR family [Clostridium pasteurianum DSM 525 = ATCC 6013]|uniref:Transcriptional regulator, MerR family n=1 Tax=Clostridium pasteurianum DSM 525 = ATCC 6013 TaxID=1262449 RepID=A0A0H3JB63_CLOPA|nr:MerR family transcriptional regulator [Clostridium pasteurianum]AJA49180.1 putative transcriptional regulator, MerR family [Clostridium pasteurianum DSM 525 = ATCC 6013]AJA53168.1 putative transcriptional regulator, MerR family [Clostridium pasteurianum DSM 525 = ATCC 6013]AOZ76363.1 MerR family transcriptional regulator [Clostridium pasteurianum DSM 525 = ATCC 6013]AOZ80160.1 MerR family transcriptional regulator [Clostridium pasteurianum]ELP59111.1 MerR family transcriptional regulator [C
MKYYIGEFSKKVGVSIDTLRYYEKLGLIYPERDSINKRIYSEKDISWINFIIRLKEINMPINQIQYYSELRYQGDSTAEKRLELLEKQMNRLNAEKERIEENIHHLNKKIDAYKQMLKDKDK